MTAEKKNINQNNINISDASKLISSMATILINAIKNYWLSKADYNQAVKDCFALLTRILNGCDVILFRIIDDVLMINGNTIDKKSSNVQMFIDHIASLDIHNFSILNGISFEEFSKFLEIIDARPFEIEQLGGFISVLNTFNIKHVESKKLIIREISEEEAVVSLDEVGTSSSGRAGNGKRQGSGKDGETVGSILAFLKGDISTEDKKTVKDVQDVASDPSKMAELILQAAEIQQQTADLEGGETMIDFVVGCLRRTYDGVTQSKSAKTKTGKKKITRNLLLLEKEILDKMRDMSTEWKDNDLSAISDVAEELTDELKIDSLTDDYVSKRNAIDESEEKLLDIIKSKGADEASVANLHDKLIAKGLSLDGWQELVIKSGGSLHGMGSGAGEGIGGGGGGLIGEDGIGINILDAFSHLDTLLDRMEKQFSEVDKQTKSNNVEELMDVFTNVNQEVNSLMAETNRTIQNLVGNIRADGDIAESIEKKALDAGTDLQFTRKEILNTLSKIARELIEPVTLIKSALDMIDSKTFGKLTKKQSSVLNMAAKSADSMNSLIDNLQNISKK